ncbi:anthranilate synthase component I [Erwinia sp. OLTSP20]|uniref:anthranilate synthase component 1 n=1 Tax=unclassified Erwinia TaxID=2622719 RepID=UPI000C191EBD|nr:MULTISPECIES: anthranilate synthase component 1 [unclassified Erwinia]PIJ51808.1 anthranilate synthase component I [Erwinia sp. OAMSP11]PIJ74396.1 anthranilate synthase component I [Erwinia sp. OLSSP12]PIJ83771.1 anthranilate synthase component I [Erwinia sp. OLCASP19]PIJ86814.1 anthranilate synthase component I [Erwinia sp. OLMTSP26]PIJ88221.1 anthranilate synthase component I [Erwinia sp. OLMDSP33]
MPTVKPALKLISSDAPYREDATSVFNQLCGARPASLLLESADIDSKHNLKSLLIIDSALRITALGQQVTIKALSLNGSALLPLLDAALPDQIDNCQHPDGRTLTFPTVDDQLDEDSRLKSVSVFDALRLITTLVSAADNEREAMFLGGLFAYDLVAGFEDLPQLESDQRCPDYCFYLAETLLIIDHQTQQSRLQASVFGQAPAEFVRLQSRLEQLRSQMMQPAAALTTSALENMTLSCNLSDETFCQVVRDMQQAIRVGEIFQVVPSRRFSLPCPSPLAAYSVLKKSNPSPYMFFMQDDDFTLFGASPESSLKYDASSHKIEIYPIAGSRPRGRLADGTLDRDLDSRIELEMRTDHKELAEHLMLVDLARNDLARICVAGSRYVADLTKVDRYSFIMHLVSRVVGELRPELDVLHAYRACMNMGTLSGAPKVRAMQLIAGAEQSRRGAYGGAVGYFTAHGDLDTCIVIRSAYVEEGVAYVQAGAGVVLDSDPQAEADESRNKARAVLRAIASAHHCKEMF